MTDFLNAKSSYELRAMDIEDKTSIVMEINKIVQNNIYRKKQKPNWVKLKNLCWLLIQTLIKESEQGFHHVGIRKVIFFHGRHMKPY